MESVGSISESEWSYFSAMYSSEESDLMVQLLSNFPTPNEFHYASSFGYPSFLPEHEESMIMTNVDIGSLHSLDNVYTNANCHSLGSSTSYEDGSSFTYGGHYVSDSDHVLWTNNDSVFDYCTEEAKVTYSNGHVNLNNQEDTNNTDTHENSLYFSSGAQLTEPSKEVELKSPKQKSKKRCSNSGDVEKSKRNVQSKKKQKLNTISTNEEDKISAIPTENSSSCCSEDENNTLNQLNGGGILISDLKADVAADTSGKKRANNGSATDPQSLYARKRREKINERLRILQNLVPNGTKVDISTMLEEAVQYVKFLQLQIKLLSSDELWMYAPIAYNGMNLGLDMKINVPKGG